MKRHIRIDWFCYRVRKGRIVHFPNVSIPVEVFARLQEVDFVGERFLVPSPPEEYLRCKYGPNWATPKRIGYEKDVVDNLPAEQPAWPRRLWRFLAARLAGRTAVLQYGKSWSYSRWACNFAHQALARDSGLPMGA